ncbi:MAG: phage terminase large subunit [Synergistaceae bacterium]|jgi:predicted phage terminase large subunit-like protein|nr:phage terminase large subunit [Synergistaceae bacterium]
MDEFFDIGELTEELIEIMEIPKGRLLDAATAKLIEQRKKSEASFRNDLATYAAHVSKGAWTAFRHLQYAADKVTDAIKRGNARIIITMPPRHGKALEISTPILTTDGWRRIDELKVGDFVFHPSGKPIEVVWCSDIFKDRESFIVTTDDGASVVADADHEWSVRLCRKRDHVYKNHTTKYLADRSCDRNAKIPKHEALLLEKKSLPIPPYTLGVWLGDGSSHYGAITQDPTDMEFVDKKINSDGFKTRRSENSRMYLGILGLIKKLRAHKLLKNKHIPDEYLLADRHQRLSLLQGLIDTDGHVAPDGQVEFCSTNINLAFGVQFLVRSLGAKASLIEGRAKLYDKDCGAKYRVMFYMKDAASLPRKANLCRDTVKTPSRFISVNPCGLSNTRCIQVDSPDGLFLAGSGLITTHNSETFSHYLPMWFLECFPQKKVILTTYDSDLSKHFGMRVRDAFLQNERVLGRIKHDSKEKSWWSTIEGGGMLSASFGESITGKGMHLGIIDDPLKNWKEAQSPSVNQAHRDWFESTFYTRLEPGASIVVVSTRWTKKDLVGWLISEHSDDWIEIRLPAIAEENDILGREPGEALCPERYPVERLLGPNLDGGDGSVKKAVGAQKWPGLFQQTPTELEGGLFKRTWWRRWTMLPSYPEDQLISMDCSFMNLDDSSFVVMQWIIRKGENYYIGDQVRARMDFVETKAAFKDFCRKHPTAHEKLIEGKANGPAIISELKNVIGGIRKWTPKGKEAQAIAISPYAESGNILLPDSDIDDTSWVGEFINELADFPKGANDDQVDTLCQGVLRLIERKSKTSEINIDESILDDLGRYGPWSAVS